MKMEEREYTQWVFPSKHSSTSLQPITSQVLGFTLLGLSGAVQFLYCGVLSMHFSQLTLIVKTARDVAPFKSVSVSV